LGLAIQMIYLRHPSRVLPPNEAPFPPLLGIVAAQLKVTPAVWSQYARRDETRREHLQELLERFELRQFDRSDYRALIDWLSPLALQTTQGMVLAHAVANELRTRHILLPTVAMLEKMCAIALTRAERETFRRLTAGLTDTHRAALEALEDTNRLAGADGLPDVRINDKGLKISPLEDDTPPEAKLLKSQTYGLLPHVKITDLLLEVDRWTNFTRHFTHLKSAEPAVDRAMLLTAILADAFNLGLEKMAEACPGTSLSKLAWLVAWHIRDESYLHNGPFLEVTPYSDRATGRQEGPGTSG
jgi:Domain of unknown function (DUF4158)/Tn3 transposase DDE domain